MANSFAVILSSFALAPQALSAELSPEVTELIGFISQERPAGAELSDAVVNDTVKRSIDLIDRGDFKQATNTIIQTIKISKHPHPVLITALANVFLVQIKVELAVEVAKKAHELNTGYDWPLMIMANGMIQLKQFDQAKQAIFDLEKIAKTSDSAALKGDWYRAQARLLDADKFYAEAVSRKPDSIPLKKLRFWNLENAVGSMIEAKNYDAALKELGKLESANTAFDTYKYRGQVYQNLERREDAELEYEKSAKTFPSDETKDRLFYCRLKLAQYYYDKQKYTLAHKWLDATEAVQKTPEVDALRADVYRQQGQNSQAEIYYRRAQPFAKTNGYVYESMSWNYILTGNNEGAEEALRDAIKANPADTRYQVALALNQKRQNKIIEAMDSLQKARELIIDKRSNDRFDEIYPLDFFDYSPAAGYGLDAFHIPTSLAASAARNTKITDIESAVRGLGLQQIDSSRYNLYLPVLKNQFAEYEIRTNVYSDHLPLFNIYYRNQTAIEGVDQTDPTYDKHFNLFSLDLTHSKRISKNLNLDLKPVLRITDSSGTSANNETLLGESYHNRDYAYGVHLALQPINKAYLIDTSLVTDTIKQDSSNLKYQTYSYSMHLYTSPWERVALDVGGDFFESPKDPANSRLLRQEYEGGGAVFFPVRSSIAVHYRTTIYTDKLNDGPTVLTKIKSPHAELRLWPSNAFGTELGVTQFSYDTYDSYNHDTYDFGIIFIPRWLTTRTLKGNKNSVPYSLPIEMRLSYFIAKFDDKALPDNNRIKGGKTYNGVSYALKLFW